MTYRVLAVNPGSTSTKIALYDDDTVLFTKTVNHNPQAFSGCAEIYDQYPLRQKAVVCALEEAGYSLKGIDAVSGRGGGLVSCVGGVYEVNDLLYHHASICLTAKHPAALGAVLARHIGENCGARAFIVDPVTTDEMQPVARITGVKGIYRKTRFHALNQREVGRLAAAKLGKRYEDARLIVVHLGGGISVAAHKDGRCVDATDTGGGEDMFTPTRVGQTPLDDIIRLCFSGRYTQAEIMDLLTIGGGFLSHFGTSDALQVKAMAMEGDGYAALVYQAMLYQICKAIGGFATVLDGKVDAVVLTGSMARGEDIVSYIRNACGFIAPILVFSGEYELNALARGALRVLRGEETPREYTGVPVFCPGDMGAKEEDSL